MIHGTPLRMRNRVTDRAVAESLNGRVALACSGGLDSTALVVLAADARLRGDAAAAIVVHVDHAARAESASEAERVSGLARRLSLPFVRTRAAWPDDPGHRRREHELRHVRYEALARLAGSLQLDAVITAHTLDDQVETILMRLLSGAGGTGAAGMKAASTLHTSVGEVVIRRPLLGVSRAELTQLVSAADVVHLEDPTNQDRSYRRNALRHDVIPKLRDTFPGFERALIRSVKLSALDAEALDGMSDELFESIVDESDDGITMPRSALRDAAPAVAGRLIRAAVCQLTGVHCRELTFERVSSIITAASGRAGAVIEVPGGIAVRVGRTHIVFTREGGRT